MKWMALSVMSCAFLATLAACGTEPRRAAPAKAPVADETTEATEAPESPAAAKPETWPGVDDDPSLEAPPGSGDWCGTGRPRVVPGLEAWPGIRSGGRVVIPWVQDGKTRYLGATWSEPDARSVQMRVHSEPLTDAELLRLRDRRDALEEEIRAAKERDADADALRAARAEYLRVYRLLLRRQHPAWVQFGKQVGPQVGGVFHMSREGETLDMFLARIAK